MRLFRLLQKRVHLALREFFYEIFFLEKAWAGKIVPDIIARKNYSK